MPTDRDRGRPLPPWLVSPQVLAVLPALVLSIWHRVYFIGLHSFDDAWYQATADDHAGGAFSVITRSAPILFYKAATALAPSRSWALLGLGALKTYLLVASVTALLRREIGVALAFAVGCLAALTGSWHWEYTFLLPDSWMTVLCLCCLACLYGVERPRLVLAGALLMLAFYSKELAAAILLVVLLYARGTLRAYWRFALGALLIFVGLWATVTVIQRQVWNPLGGLTPLLIPTQDVLQPFAAKARKMLHFAGDDSNLGRALTVFYGIGFVAALVSRRWTSVGGRALVAWTVVIWVTYLAAVAATGFYDPRYTIGPRIGLAIAGIMGWLVVLANVRVWRLRPEALQAALIVVLFSFVTLHGLLTHRAMYAPHLVAQDLERRVADLIDRLPTSMPVTVYVDPRDPEDTMGLSWWPHRVWLRVITLSETSPPRQVRWAQDKPVALPPGEVYITNIAPEQLPPDTMQVTFVSELSETARRMAASQPGAEQRKRYRGIRKLYVVLPRDVTPPPTAAEIAGPTRTMWR